MAGLPYGPLQGLVFLQEGAKESLNKLHRHFVGDRLLHYQAIGQDEVS